MKKILRKVLNAYGKAAGWLCGFGSDKWLHFIVGLVIAFVVGCVASEPLWSAGLLGVLIAFVVGFAKEIADSFTGGNGDLVDVIFTTIGGLAGFGLLMLTLVI